MHYLFTYQISIDKGPFQSSIIFKSEKRILLTKVMQIACPSGTSTDLGVNPDTSLAWRTLQAVSPCLQLWMWLMFMSRLNLQVWRCRKASNQSSVKTVGGAAGCWPGSFLQLWWLLGGGQGLCPSLVPSWVKPGCFCVRQGSDFCRCLLLPLSVLSWNSMIITMPPTWSMLRCQMERKRPLPSQRELSSEQAQ